MLWPEGTNKPISRRFCWPNWRLNKSRLYKLAHQKGQDRNHKRKQMSFLWSFEVSRLRNLGRNCLWWWRFANTNGSYKSSHYVTVSKSEKLIRDAWGFFMVLGLDKALSIRNRRWDADHYSDNLLTRISPSLFLVLNSLSLSRFSNITQHEKRRTS